MSNYIYYNGELYHASDKKSQHKYIKKVKINGKWRYYYKDKNTGSKYGTYTNKKGTDTYTVKKSDKWFSSTKTTTKNKIYRNNKVEGKDVVYTEGRLTRAIARGKKKITKALKKLENKKGASNFLKKGAKMLSKLFKTAKTETKIPKTHKYIQRIKTASGKFLYFYDQAAYDRYLTKQKYQKNEPKFMKKVPDSTDRSLSKDDDMSEVNEKYSPYSQERSQNCAYCTAAYELRSRGYDVQAATNIDMDSYEAKGADYLSKWYEDPDTIYLNEKGKKDRSIKAWLHDGTTKQKKIDYDMNTVQKGILEYSGKNTRGEIRVTWKQGGAHSMIYEVDGKGKVTVRDAQTNRVYDLSEFESGSHAVNRIAITRTDNLKLKKGILNVVENNKSEVRDYVVRDGRVIRADGGNDIWF